jgi:predicted DNA-binding protein
MSTITIRLTEELKARVACAAERAGKTTHSFIQYLIDRAAGKQVPTPVVTKKSD